MGIQTSNSQVDAHIQPKHMSAFFCSGFFGVMGGVMFFTNKIVYDLLLT